MKYKVLLDYDNLPFSSIAKDVQKLIRKFKLKSAVVYVSSKRRKPYHYHVHFERLVETTEEWRKIILESNCCENYKEYAQIFDFVILRTRGTKMHPYPYAIITEKKVNRLFKLSKATQQC